MDPSGGEVKGRVAGVVSIALGVLAFATTLVFPTLALLLGVAAVTTALLSRRRLSSTPILIRLGLEIGIIAVIGVVVVVLVTST